VEQDKIVDRL